MKKVLWIVVIVLLAAVIVNSTVSILYIRGNASLSHELKQQQQQNEQMKKQLAGMQKDYNTMRQELSNVMETKASFKGKVAFLTFDDGPSAYTKSLLDTLESRHVHATFFVVGTNAEKYEDTVKREHADGDAVGIHCWSHQYSVCYASVDAFFDDFNHIKTYLTTLLGTAPNICRFPGDTNNTVSNDYVPHFMQQVVPKVESMGVHYFDWNVESGDSDGKNISVQQIISNVVGKAEKYHNPVILCHDIKKGTVDAVPQIIDQLKALGYSFAVLSPIAPACQFKPI